MKAETKESVTAKIKELRAHISKEKGDKIAEGRKGKGPKAGHEEDEKGPERDTQEAGKAGGARRSARSEYGMFRRSSTLTTPRRKTCRRL